MIDVEVLEMFNEKLGIAYVGRELCEEFLKSMTRYLKHSKADANKVGGRTKAFLEEKLNEFINLFSSFGYNAKELVIIISNNPYLLNVINDCYFKLLLLGVIENSFNEVRKEKIITRTKDFMMSIEKIYARYKLICNTGYDKCNWTNLLSKSENEFCKIFVNKSGMPHQIFNNLEEVKNYLYNIDVSDFNIEEFKSMDVNKEFVAKYEQNTKRY